MDVELTVTEANDPTIAVGPDGGLWRAKGDRTVPLRLAKWERPERVSQSLFRSVEVPRLTNDRRHRLEGLLLAEPSFLGRPLLLLTTDLDAGPNAAPEEHADAAAAEAEGVIVLDEEQSEAFMSLIDEMSDGVEGGPAAGGRADGAEEEPVHFLALDGEGHLYMILVEQEIVTMDAAVTALAQTRWLRKLFTEGGEQLAHDFYEVYGFTSLDEMWPIVFGADLPEDLDQRLREVRTVLVGRAVDERVTDEFADRFDIVTFREYALQYEVEYDDGEEDEEGVEHLALVRRNVPGREQSIYAVA